jgi:hypothetical protein
VTMVLNQAFRMHFLLDCWCISEVFACNCTVRKCRRCTTAHLRYPTEIHFRHLRFRSHNTPKRDKPNTPKESSRTIAKPQRPSAIKAPKASQGTETHIYDKTKLKFFSLIIRPIIKSHEKSSLKHLHSKKTCHTFALANKQRANG